MIESPVCTPHWVEVLDRADDDAIVFFVAHDLHLDLFPADQRLLDQQFVHRAGLETALADRQKLLLVVGDTATRAAQRKRGTNDRRKTDSRLDFLRLGHRMGDTGARRLQADVRHRRLEFLTILGFLDGVRARADHFDAVLLQYAVARQIERAVERRLPAHRRQQRIGTLLLDDPFHNLPGDRLDVGRIGHPRIGHDRRRIGVDEDDAVALFTQCLACLHARIVELAGLADDDRPGADDEDGLDVGSLRHRSEF